MEPSETDLHGANTTNEALSSMDATVPSPSLADIFARNALTEDRLAGHLDDCLKYIPWRIDLNQPLASYEKDHILEQMYGGFVLAGPVDIIPSIFVHRNDYSKTFKEIFLQNWPKSYGELIDRSDGSGKGFQWNIPRDPGKEVNITYRAYSHDREDPLPDTIFELSTLEDGSTEPASEPVGHGKIWIFWHVNFSSVPHSTLSIQSIAYLFSNFRAGLRDGSVLRALWLLSMFTDKNPLSYSSLIVPSLQSRPDLSESAHVASEVLSTPDIELKFKMAYLGSVFEFQGQPKTGVVVYRETAKLPSLNDYTDSKWGFKTTVMMISAFLSPTPDRPYQISGIVDYIGDGPLLMRVAFDDMPQGSTWQTFGLRSCGRCAGVGQFLCLAMLFFVRWEKGWMHTLDKIDESVSFELEDTLHRDKIDSLMFDESFRRSKLYFTILQLLRSSSNMVDETRREWKKLHQQWAKDVDVPGTLFSSDDLQALSCNWEVASKAIDAARERINERITRKTEEIKSLRDGLFNATALREATKSIALSRAIYVFTVVTVIYTPIGFLAAFWALPFFQRPAENGSTNDQFLVPRGFTATFIVVPILTYLIAMLVAFSLGYSGAERRVFKERAFRYCRPIIRFYRTIIQKVQHGWEMGLDTLRNLRAREQGSDV